MTPATWPRSEPSQGRLLRIDPGRGTFEDGRIAELPGLLRPLDLLVVNDAATLPASLPARTAGGVEVEVRLMGRNPTGDFPALLLGAGDWRTPTEKRPPPSPVAAGEHLTFGPDLSATLREVSPLSARLVTLHFDSEEEQLWSALYRHGRPVQYAYIERPLALFHVQTAYAARPWAAELPSAGHPLSLGLLLDLRRRGVALATLTHAAGISSSGEKELDARLPLPESFEIPAATVEAVACAKGRGGRVVAVGTSVVRALEGSVAEKGVLGPGAGITDLRIDASFHPQVVDGLLTGLHEPGTGHFALLSAFAGAVLLERAYAYADTLGYLGHEFGDSSLILSE